MYANKKNRILLDYSNEEWKLNGKISIWQKKFIPADLAHCLELWMKITSAIQNEIEELG